MLSRQVSRTVRVGIGGLAPTGACQSMSTATVLTDELLRTQLVPQLLAAMPGDWRGTTFNNSNLLGREVFSDRLQALLVSKAATKQGEAGVISESDLSELGNAEDYLRVASNVCTVYENVLALGKGLPVEQVFSFASSTMPVVAVALTRGPSGGTVHLFHGDKPSPFSAADLAKLTTLGANLTCHPGSPPANTAAASSRTTVLALDHAVADDAASSSSSSSSVDGIVGSDGTLFITNPDTIDPSTVMKIRKRMAIPITTPAAEAALQKFCGLEVTADTEEATQEQVAAFNAHLQTMSGTAVNLSANPVSCQAGLPTIASLWLTLENQGGADILMCSTAYGGSSELTDICLERGGKLRKATFDIQGGLPIDASIQSALDKLASNQANLYPTTVLFAEIPSNPDQKIPDIAKLAASLEAYRAKTGKEVLLFVDTTFAPASQVLGKLEAIDTTLQAMVFVSMSKSVSRGTTTAGALVANHTSGSCALVNASRETASLLDTHVKKDQLYRLCTNHTGVEARCQSAYEVTLAMGKVLTSAVATHSGAGQEEAMELTYVHPEHAALGFTSSTFSFNLPVPTGADEATKVALAQRFVDLLTEDAERFKPCVSFGQDNGLVYCTVPATSTQGAIKAEDKAKQAKGGVQLARLSFPPAVNLAAVQARIEMACATIYSNEP